MQNILSITSRLFLDALSHVLSVINLDNCVDILTNVSFRNRLHWLAEKDKKTKEINGKYTSVEKGDGIVVCMYVCIIVDLHMVRGKGEKEEEE